jgi:predicted helicase
MASNRDTYNYNDNAAALRSAVSSQTVAYSEAVAQYASLGHGRPNVDEFIDTDDKRLKWTRQTKRALSSFAENRVDDSCFRASSYRPFHAVNLYFQDFWNEERYQQHLFFPKKDAENTLIVVAVYGRRPFAALSVNQIPDINFYGEPGQCFPFYTYDENGTNRRENITDWALREFRKHYSDNSISKWDIFHYTYGLLHHPEYRTRYAANLKRELPRIPMAPEFPKYAETGAALMKLHIDYEKQAEYPFQRTETGKLNWRVEKMALSKEKAQLKYNEFLTLSGIPPEVYNYRLGNRSALEWVIDQYRVSTDQRSGIVNDPNREDDPEYIVRLIGQVVTVSIETVRLVKELETLSIDQTQ